MLKLAVRKMVTNIKAGGEKNGRKNMNGCVMLNWDDFSKGRFGFISWTYIPKKLWIFTCAHVWNLFNRNVKGLLVFLSGCWNTNTLPCFCTRDMVTKACFMVCFRNVNTQFRFFSGNVTCYLIVNYQRLSGSHTTCMLMILFTFHFKLKKNLKIFIY